MFLYFVSTVCKFTLAKQKKIKKLLLKMLISNTDISLFGFIASLMINPITVMIILYC